MHYQGRVEGNREKVNNLNVLSSIEASKSNLGEKDKGASAASSIYFQQKEIEGQLGYLSAEKLSVVFLKIPR